MPLPTLNAAANSAAYLVAALFVLRVVWFQQQHGRSRRVLLLLIYTLVVVAYPVLPYAVLATRETAPDFTAVWLRPWVLLAAPGFAFLALVTQRYGQQRQREAEMAELQEQMMQKEALLMQNLNHELRTPFALMYGYIELIGDGAMGQLPDKVAQVIAAVRKKLTYARLLLERNLLLLTEDEYQFALSEMSTAELCAEAVADARELAALRESLRKCERECQQLKYALADEQTNARMARENVDMWRDRNDAKAKQIADLVYQVAALESRLKNCQEGHK